MAGLFGVVVSFLLGWASLEQERTAIETQFELDAVERGLVIQERLEDAAKALNSLSALYLASDEVRREQFSVFTEPILALHPYIRALSWNEYILDAERTAHEQRLKAEGFADYSIAERGEGGALVPSRPRRDYVVVTYIEPFEANKSALGFDVASEPVRRAALQRARETGEFEITDPIRLVQEQGDPSGFLGFIPVYEDRAGGSLPPDANALKGFAVAVFLVRSLVEGALSHFDPSPLDIYLIDSTTPEDESLLFASAAASRRMESTQALPPPSQDPLPRRSTLLTVGGRQWRLDFVPTKAYVARLRTRTPLAILLVSLLLTVLTTAYVVLFTGRAARVQLLVDERTRELADANRDLRQEVEWRQRVEAELTEYRNRLEDKVQERTAELESANSRARQEIGHRREAEEALSSSEERLKLTLAAVSDGAWDWNVATGEMFFSDKWFESLGYERSDLEPHVDSWRNLVHPDDRSRVTAAFEAHFDGHTEIHECENRLLMKCGKYRWNLNRGRVVARDGNSRPLRMVGTDTDITALKQAELEQSRVDLQVQQAQKLESLGVLAGGIAHDFNNLLMGVLGNADLALEDMSRDSLARERVHDIATAAKRAAQLANQLLAYAGKAEFVVEPTDLSDLVSEMSKLIEVSVSKRVAIEYRLAQDLPTVEVDATQVRQVALNLITNASEATEGSEGVIRIASGTMECDRAYLSGAYVQDDNLGEGTYAFIEVADNGKGMDAETLSRIFDPFYTTKFKGRGLGLAAVLGIVRGHQAAMRVESEPDRGTTVRVLFPVSARAKADRGRPPVAASTWQGTGTVLLVDDEELVRGVGETMLGRLGFNVLVAPNGREAVRIFRARADDISVVLVDLEMPQMNGEETFRAISRIRRDARVVLCSGYSEPDTLTRLRSQGLAGFVQKPYSLEDLREKLQSVLER